MKHSANKYIILKFFPLIFCLYISTSYSSNSFKLTIPIDCEYGTNCFIQNYVDLNSSVGYKDYKCGFLTYNKHKGTDFRLLDYKQMTQGVKVLAAASGKVLRTRTKERDFNYLEHGISKVKDKECGNAILIEHDDGYTTQYCHLLKNSIIVEPGQEVQAGDKLGYVGMSGQTEFPHLHITVKKGDDVIDPFIGVSPSEDYKCTSQNDSKPLWNNESLAKLEYIDTAILNFFATDKEPDKLAARAGGFREDKLTKDSDKIIFWTDVMGVHKEDRLVFTLKDANGNKVFESVNNIPQKYVLYFAYSGKKFNSNRIKPGEYQAEISLYRRNDKIKSKMKIINVL